MQKAFIALVLALALSSAVAVNYTATNWFKGPVQILDDTDYNFTNSLYLTLGAMTASDINVFALRYPVQVDPMNSSSIQWTLFTKGFDPNDLTPLASNSYNFTSSQFSGFVSGHVLGYGVDKDSNGVPQIWFYQINISDGSILPRVVMTSNTNASFTPLIFSITFTASKNIAFVYQAADTKVNYTSITIGGSTPGREFTLSTTWNTTTDNFYCEWGGALPSSQVFAAYTEAGVYKVAVIDFISGYLIDAGIVTGKYEKTFKCLPYVTDINYYGLFCFNTTGSGQSSNLTYFISSNSTNELVLLQTVNGNTHQFQSISQYGSDLAIFSMDPSNYPYSTLSYEIWDVSALKIVKNKTDFLTYNPMYAGFSTYKFPQGGLYGLVNENSRYNLKSKVVVGQILDNPTSRQSITSVLAKDNSVDVDFLPLI